jgi:hypothetical protein
VTSKEIGLEVNADKTKYMVMSREQYAVRSHSIKTDNSSFKRVEDFIYLGTISTNQNSIQDEIKSRLKSENACYHSVQNILSSSFQSKHLKIKIYRTIILSDVLYGWETWSLTLREERRLRVSENRVLRRVPRASSPTIVRVIKSRIMRRVRHVARIGEGEACTGFWWGDLGERATGETQAWMGG